jgi:hypothetical protein
MARDTEAARTGGDAIPALPFNRPELGCGS